MTFSLLPDFFASRRPGKLQQLEDIVATAEAAPSREQAVEELWPAFDEGEEVNLDTGLNRVRRGIGVVKSILVTSAGLFPEIFVGSKPTITSFRKNLGTKSVLFDLREIAKAHLHALPPPLGFGQQPQVRKRPLQSKQQSLAPDRPP